MVGTASISSQSVQRTSEVRVMLEAKFGYGLLAPEQASTKQTTKPL